jgi:hypothetical protein
MDTNKSESEQERLLAEKRTQELEELREALLFPKGAPLLVDGTRRQALLDLHKELSEKAFSIMLVKNHDYTSNADDPYANFRSAEFLGVDPVIGVLLRMMDKTKRIQSFVEQGRLAVQGESVEDAVIDIMNYAIIIRGLLLDGQDEPSVDDGPFA